MNFTLQLKGGRRVQYDYPVVMGIINLTPDSFYAGSRTLAGGEPFSAQQEEQLRQRVRQMIQEGAEMIDVGACSTRPNYVPPTPEEELQRLQWGLPIVRQETDLPISVDTYRAEVARVAVSELGADIVNDVYGGTRDPEMVSVVNALGVPFILGADSDDVAGFFRRQIPLFNKEVQLILDPDFGFSKTLDQNYEVLADLPKLLAEFPDYVMLVGVSRKSMIWRLLDITPNEALNSTTVLNTISLQAGAHILRVHDVLQAREAVRLVEKMKSVQK